MPTIEGYLDAPLVTDEDVLSGDAEPAGCDVVVVGASRRALATALYCADRNARVTVVDHDLRRAAYDASALMRRAYKQQLEARGVPILAGPITRLSAASVVLPDRELAADLVVLSARLTSIREALTAIPAGMPVTVVGDAKEPRSIMDAVAEAREAVDHLHATG